ncbi:MarR family winged helix-turn-helix transcriptional regulator [Roseibium sp. MMSF_3544]|uniref:MarR family winged helix-turn-helix transcriptional regulator n=1 Tax=unclassified Roseibium TaxID=2629323 RepID=UPI00273DC8C4|nr:MarR family transcriptional regulator [Roseibium sp. MMSF_3544]
MKEPNHLRVLRDLIDRVSRLSAAEDWNGPLNPSQFAALAYLARANRFSRAPSHVADYLATTRGTASQTLKALARKDFIAEVKSETDKRSIRYDVTDTGKSLLDAPSGVTDALESLPRKTTDAFESALKDLIREILKKRGGRTFGMCQTCRHHQQSDDDLFCSLLNVPLSASDAVEICHEHQAA